MKLSVENLFFSYANYAVLQGINFSLDKNEFICIAGPNGSGKSTFVKCIDGLLSPGSGKVFIDGKKMNSLSRTEIAKLIGYVPQNTRQLFSETVFDTVLMGRKPYYSWKYSNEDIEIVSDILQKMELADLAMKDFNQLSGGQQQRVLIARAIAQQPKLLLLDEPTSALDISFQLEVMDLLRSLMSLQDLSVIMVIHDLNLAARYADRVLLLHNGKIACGGSPHETLTQENIEKIYGVKALVQTESNILSVIPIERIRQ